MSPDAADAEAPPSPEPFDFEGDYGRGYETLARTVIPGYLSSFRQALALLRGRVPPDARLLVVGAGTGIEIVTFKSAEPGWRFTGVDPSARMIGIARRRIVEAGLEEGVELRRGTAASLDEGAFDAATCFNVMHFLADDGAKRSLLESVADRLSSGAALVLFDLHGEPGTPAFEEMYGAWRAYWRIQGMGEAERTSFREKIETGIHWVSERRILELLEEAGFREVRPFFRGLLYGGWIARRGP